MRKEIVVLGLGNPLMSDEGIGGFLVDQLEKQVDQFPQAEFIDAGTGGMNLLYHLEDRKKVIIIDCAFMDTEPGTMKRFGPDEVVSIKKLAHLSLHEVDILKVIELAKRLGQCPEEIVIFGIEPESIEQKMELTKILADKIDDYIETIVRELTL